MFFIEILIVSLFALVFGSFTTAISYRIPQNIPWAFQGSRTDHTDEESAYRSSCTNCKTPLKILDLIPVFSWVISGGKCRHCGQKISISYPLTELSVLALAITAYLVNGFSFQFIWVFLSIPFLVSLTVIDLKTFTLPNQLVAILFILGVLRGLFDVFIGKISVFQEFLIIHAGGAVIYGLFAWFLGRTMSKILKKDALGFGDVKFFVVAGLWLGVPMLPYFLMISGGLGVVLALLWRQITKNEIFPFGPALIASFYILLLIQSSHFSEFALN